MKIYLDSIGCRLNQSEIERFGRDFRQAGHTLAARPSEADIAVLNTCAVTAKASSDSRHRARRIGEHVREGVILTGCWSTLEPQKAMRLPNVRQVVPNTEKRGLINIALPNDPIESDQGLIAREPLPGIRSRTRAFVKVQDGCDLRCSYCITTIARGPGRSIPIQQVIDEIRYAQRGGVNEVILTGVHLGSWGQDLQPVRTIDRLIRAILGQTDIPRIRLSSLEPWNLEPAFFSLWQDKRLCRHLHLPLQSGSDRVLRRMGRRTTTSEFVDLIASARSQIPDVAITTDFIVGFPGETDTDFEQTHSIIQELEFAGGHVFTYSERAGTAASTFEGRIATSKRKERNAVLRNALQATRRNFCKKQIGKLEAVLWEGISGSGPEGYKFQGWTDNYIRVEGTFQDNRSNTISMVNLRRFSPDGSTMVVSPLE